MALPIFQSSSRELLLLQTGWASQIDPVLQLPLNSGVLLKSVVLASGPNTINHTLGRKLQGWILTRVRSSATVYDTQDTNSQPTLTLQLTASAGVTVDLFVF